MRAKVLIGLLFLLARPAIAAAQDRVTGEVVAGGAFMLEEEHSGFYGYLLTAGISFRGLGIQGELWKSGDETTVSGPSLIFSPFYKATFSPYLQVGFLAYSEGGWALAFGGGMRIRFAKFMGLRAEIRFTGHFGIVSGGVFVRI